MNIKDTTDPVQKEVFNAESPSRHSRSGISHLSKVIATGELHHRRPSLPIPSAFNSQVELSSKAQQTKKQSSKEKLGSSEKAGSTGKVGSSKKVDSAEKAGLSKKAGSSEKVSSSGKDSSSEKAGSSVKAGQAENAGQSTQQSSQSADRRSMDALKKLVKKNSSPKQPKKPLSDSALRELSFHQPSVPAPYISEQSLPEPKSSPSTLSRQTSHPPASSRRDSRRPTSPRQKSKSLTRERRSSSKRSSISSREPSIGREESVRGRNSQNRRKKSLPSESKSQLNSIRSPSVTKPKRFFPKPYTFRIPVPRGRLRPPTEGIVKSPPFYIQLDHTLAVIWSLFCKDQMEAPLGIAQLQWALLFLKGIYNRKGQHPKDVEVCIQAIQDQLIDQYASLMDEPNMRAHVIRSVSGHSRSDHQGLSFHTASRISNLNASCHSGFQQEARSGSKLRDGGYGGDGDLDARISRSGIPPGGLRKSRVQLNPSQVSMHRALCTSDTTFSRRIPFSINYAQMSFRKPKGMQELFLRPCIKRSFVEEIDTPRKVISGSRLVPNDLQSQDFLNTIRKEQIDRIQGELKTLHLIEEYIEKGQQIPSQKPPEPVPIMSGMPPPGYRSPPPSALTSPSEQFYPPGRRVRKRRKSRSSGSGRSNSSGGSIRSQHNIDSRGSYHSRGSFGSRGTSQNRRPRSRSRKNMRLVRRKPR